MGVIGLHGKTEFHNARMGCWVGRPNWGCGAENLACRALELGDLPPDTSRGLLAEIRAWR